jgi:small conductance mechanosensitive channel
MAAIWARLRDVYDLSGLVDQTLLWLPNLIVALLTALFFFLLYRGLRRGFRFVVARAELDATLGSFLETVLRYVLAIVGTVTVLGQVGVDVTSMVASLGVAGLTIGFAAKDALSNIISGLFIFWDRPFVVGDLVEIDGRYGRVQEITMRTTRVVTPDGRMLAIPNTTVVNSTVASYTNFPNLRLEIDVTVGVGEDLGRIRRVALDVVEGRPGFQSSPAPTVVVTAINDYNVALQLRAWLVDEQRHIAERFRLREDLFEALRRADVEMPFETLAIVQQEA